MGAIVKELKEKIVAAGGDTTGIQTVSEALDKLPAGGGDSGIFVVSFTFDADANTMTSDKTVGEVIDALDSKKFVVGIGGPFILGRQHQFYCFRIPAYIEATLDEHGQFVVKDLDIGRDLTADFDNLDEYIVIIQE